MTDNTTKPPLKSSPRQPSSSQQQPGGQSVKDKQQSANKKLTVGNNKNKKSWLARIIIVMLVIVIALIAAYWRLQYQKEQKVNNQLLQLQQQLSTLSHQNKQMTGAVSVLQQNDSQLSQLTTKIDQLQTAQQQQQQTLNGIQSSDGKLHHQLSGDNSAWLVSEALYLAKLANYTLIFQHDTATSISLLETTDQLLRRTNHPKVLAVRQVIANAVSQLKATPVLDSPGLYVMLAALAQATDRLPLLTDVTTINTGGKNKTDTAMSANDNWQQRFLNNAKQVWRHLVVIQRQQSSLVAAVDGQQRNLLNQYSLLLISQAQTAVLRQDQKTYQSSLEQLMMMINKYYDTKQQTVQQILAQVSQSKQISIAPTIPDLTNVILAIQDFQQQLNNKSVAVPVQASSNNLADKKNNDSAANAAPQSQQQQTEVRQQ